MTLSLKTQLKKLNLELDEKKGHLFYSKNFIPVKHNNQLVIVRHGETYGNCGQANARGEIDAQLVKAGIKDREKRVYQGNVNAAINQLTETGKEQAKAAAIKLEEMLLAKQWLPDIIFHSPLLRAKETALPFIERNHLAKRFLPCEAIQEISFGAWENRRICDLPPNHPCHLLYLQQDVLVKESGVNMTGQYQDSECFAEVLLRAHALLKLFDQQYTGKRIILFSHSIFGAALSILFGLGQKAEGEEHLAFDGKRKNGTAYTMPFAMPILLNFSLT